MGADLPLLKVCTRCRQGLHDECSAQPLTFCLCYQADHDMSAAATCRKCGAVLTADSMIGDTWCAACGENQKIGRHRHAEPADAADVEMRLF